MGCYDTIYLENKIKCLCGKEIEDFQTKDLGQGLVSYVITKDNRLREGWKRYIDKNRKAKNYNYLSDIGFNFYSSCECGRWHDLYVIFIDGFIKKLIHTIQKEFMGKTEKRITKRFEN